MNKIHILHYAVFAAVYFYYILSGELSGADKALAHIIFFATSALFVKE